MVNAIWEHDYYKDCIPNFYDNLIKPRHRWYEFKEGYSDAFVARAIKHFETTNNLYHGTILDPFSGSGTTPLVGVESGYEAYAIEVNPFMAFISKTKTKPYTNSISLLEEELTAIIQSYPIEKKSPLEDISTFAPSAEKNKWLFNRSVLRGYEALKQAVNKFCDNEYREFFDLALFSAIMECCNAKRDGKCLRYKKSWNTMGYSSIELRKSFVSHVNKMFDDLVSKPLTNAIVKIINKDSRMALKDMSDNFIDIITFSPPYLNSFDYSDVYRPELYLGQYIKDNNELRQLRAQTLRSHVQYAWNEKSVSSSQWVADTVSKIQKNSILLWNKNIPAMINNYFVDMEDVFRECYRVAKSGAIMWFIISTSAYAGVEIPVDLILADIATKCGWNLEGVNALRNLRTSSQCIDSTIRKVRLRESMIACRK